MKRLLLDTNVAVWLLLGDRTAVTNEARAVLEDERNAVSVSAVTVWEIAIKRSLGKLTIEDRWARALTRLGFDPMPVTARHAEHVEQLAWHHRDPFDRLLIAQAQVEALPVISADTVLDRYGVNREW